MSKLGLFLVLGLALSGLSSCISMTLEEAVEKSKERPCEFNGDVYYKAQKIATAQHVLANGAGGSVAEYVEMLKRNNIWNDATVIYYTNSTGTRKQLTQNVAVCSISDVTRIYSLDGKHQISAIRYTRPVGIKRVFKDGSQQVGYRDIFCYVDEVNDKFYVPNNESKSYNGMLMSRIKEIADKEPSRFSPARK